MPVVNRNDYTKAMLEMLGVAGFEANLVKNGKIIARRDAQTLYIDVAGKNLPYRGRDGSACFEWETWIEPARLDRLEANAHKYGAEPWLAFCYAILEEGYQPEFSSTVNVNGRVFGSKLISAGEYKKHLTPRSPSWREVNLPRTDVLRLTCDLKTL